MIRRVRPSWAIMAVRRLSGESGLLNQDNIKPLRLLSRRYGLSETTTLYEQEE